MAQEAIERTILNFRPQNEGFSCEKKELGSISGTPFDAVYGVFHYQQRVITLPDEPLIYQWTRQPVIALRERQQRGDGLVTRYKTLAYKSDIRSLPEGLAEKLAAHLESLDSLTRKIFGEWEV